MVCRTDGTRIEDESMEIEILHFSREVNKHARVVFYIQHPPKAEQSYINAYAGERNSTTLKMCLLNMKTETKCKYNSSKSKENGDGKLNEDREER